MKVGVDLIARVSEITGHTFYPDEGMSDVEFVEYMAIRDDSVIQTLLRDVEERIEKAKEAVSSCAHENARKPGAFHMYTEMNVWELRTLWEQHDQLKEMVRKIWDLHDEIKAEDAP